MPLRMLLVLGKSEEDLITTNVSVSAFIGEVSKTLGVLLIEATMGSKSSTTAFFVICSTVNYQALLGRDWIHANLCVPSSLHHFLLF